MMPAFAKNTMRTGFTLIELCVVVVVISILATALLKRVIFYQEQAEKVAMEQTLGTLRSALHLQFAQLLVKGNVSDIDNLVEQNPMDWLAEKPKNYAGVYYTPKADMIEVGNWYFDMHDKNLVYLVNNSDHLHTAPGESNKIRFIVKLVRNTASTPSATIKEGESTVGVILEPAVAFKWF